MDFSKVRLPLLFLSLLLAVGSGWYMYSLTADEKLWGHLPLLFMLSAWSFFILLGGWLRKPDTSRQRFMGLALLGSVFLSAGFPVSPLTPFMFIGFVPLLIIEKELATSSEEKVGKKLFRYSYHMLVFWNILTTFWVANTAFFAGVLAVLANSLLMSIPILLFHHTRKVFEGKFGYVPFIAYWITFEYLHMQWELTWPWLTLGNSFAQYPSWVQWYEYTGVFGGSLWILGLNVLLFNLYIAYQKEGKTFWGNKLQFIRPGVILFLPILISLGIYYTYEDKGSPTEVVVVQPNFEPHYEKFNLNRQEQLNQFLRLSEEALTENTEYLVFPETSFGRINHEDLKGNPMIRQLKEFTNRYPKLKLVTGISGHKIFKPGEPHGEAVRTQVSSRGDTLFWEGYNSAFQISSGEEEVQIYLKSILVPGAENFPYRKVLFFFQPIIDALDGSVGLGKQKERSVFTSSSGKVAPIICYESIFGEYVTQYIRKGADLLFIVTNDGWWDHTAGHQQHLKFATLRAIETRRSIARSANTGISCFINQRGDIIQPTKYSESAAIKGTILRNNEFTFYIQWQDLIARLASFASILFLLNTFVKRWSMKKGVKGR